jgi:hypothetical protein
MTAATIGILFIGIALIFLCVAVRDALGSQPRPLARKTWLRVALIFSAVGINPQFLHLLH